MEMVSFCFPQQLRKTQLLTKSHLPPSSKQDRQHMSVELVEHTELVDIEHTLVEVEHSMERP